MGTGTLLSYFCQQDSLCLPPKQTQDQKLSEAPLSLIDMTLAGAGAPSITFIDPGWLRASVIIILRSLDENLYCLYVYMFQINPISPANPPR